MWLMALLGKFITAADVEHGWNHLKFSIVDKIDVVFLDFLIMHIQQPSSNNPIVLVSRE